MTIMSIKRNIRIVLVCAAMAAVVLFGTTIPASAAAQEVPMTKVTFPSSITLNIGESKTLTISTAPTNTTYQTNIEWGYQTRKRFAVHVNGHGSYWGQESSETLTGKSAGTGYLFTTVNVYDSTGKFIRQYDFDTTVKVNADGASAAPTDQTSATKETTKKKNGYRSVDEAYTELNKFRTREGVWQWKKGSKSKKRFNTNSKNKLKALKRSADLEKTAKVRAKEAAEKFSHTRPNGKSCFTAFPSQYWYRGENLACGYADAKSVTKGWKEAHEKYKGQGHRRNMLNKNFTKVGIACYEKNGVLFWAQCFAK